MTDLTDPRGTRAKGRGSFDASPSSRRRVTAQKQAISTQMVVEYDTAEAMAAPSTP